MSDELSSVGRRARIHAALGDPARLAIVDVLCLGDASPGEIAKDLELPTNLVAHHVKVLTEAGLVVRTRSEGDRRRTYLRLLPDALAALAPPRLTGVRRVLFVCTHNSARSQLAAALWGRRRRTPAASAGTRPATRVHPRAIAVARRHGLTINPTATAHITDVVKDGDLIIAVCDNAHEDLAGATSPVIPRQVRPRLHWSVPDPVPVDTAAAFEAAYTDLAARIGRIAPALTQGADNV
jgi:ArsR family transcriptional regulator, arsenate/arsenite/antimonite-responsive transcriptional repressor / arsenate reductase (thioredoxin)